MNRWFTRYLHGIQNGVENEPRAWIVREKDERTNPTSYYDYPNPAAEAVTLYPHPGAPGHGSLKSTPFQKASWNRWSTITPSMVNRWRVQVDAASASLPEQAPGGTSSSLRHPHGHHPPGQQS